MGCTIYTGGIASYCFMQPAPSDIFYGHAAVVYFIKYYAVESAGCLNEINLLNIFIIIIICLRVTALK